MPKMIGVLLFGLLCGPPLSGNAAAPALPPVVPEHYSLALTPDFEKNLFTGQEEIRIRLSKVTSTISLNAADIAFDSVQVMSDGSKQIGKVVFDKDKELVNISIAKPAGPGEITIEIRYRGTLQHSCCGFYTVRTGGLTYGVILSSARHVFPSFDEPAMKATFDLAATIRNSDQAISNGRVISDVPGPGDSQHTVTFSTTAKMSPYLLTLAIGQFECESGQTDDIPIT